MAKPSFGPAINLNSYSVMQTFTATEFFAFIKAQPDDKCINMSETDLSDPCGCLLVQFARSHGLTEGSAAMVEVYTGHGETAVGQLKADEESADDVYKIVRAALYGPVRNFADAKEMLNLYIAHEH